MAAATIARADIRSDEDIQRDVMAELEWEPRVVPNEIGVAVKDGVVTLTRRVNSMEVRLPSMGAKTDVDVAPAMVRDLEWDAAGRR